jgi:hypothetical protein
MFANLMRQSLHKVPIVFQEHVLAGKKNPHALTVADTTKGAAKQHPIKSCYSTDDAVFVPCQKTLHDSPPLDACAKDIMREEIMGRHHLFWLRPEWAASCYFVDRFYGSVPQTMTLHLVSV